MTTITRLLLMTFIAIVLMATTCRKDKDCPDNSHNGLTIINKSATRIRYIIYWNYPGTLIGEYNPKNDGTDGMTTNESSSAGNGPGSCWESVLKDGAKEWIYIFNADTIETLDWNVVRQTNRGLLERKQIDLDYLKKNNFVVTYQQ